MDIEKRGAVRLVGLVTVLAMWAGCGAEAAEDAEAEGSAGRGAITQIEIPEVDIRIDGPGDCIYLEIDDLTPSNQAIDADANLCSNNSDVTTQCPASEIARTADNPNFPGPSAGSPATLGTVEAEYCDWADLDAATHLDPFEDAATRPDDILSSAGCLLPEGGTPSKANFTVTGLAADPTGTWLYTLLERETSNGNESYEYFYLQNPALFEEPSADGCDDGQYLFEPTAGDIRVVLSYQSTAALPEATAIAEVWVGADPADPLNAKEMHTAGNWEVIANAPVYTAINVAFDRNKSPTEDTERDFDGTALASGIKVEMAVDIDAVFGGGCGLTRTMFALSSASEGPNDRIFDFLSPRVISTADLGADLSLYESCDEEFGYLVELDIEGGLEDWDDFSVTGTYQCGEEEEPTAFTVAFDGDTVAIPVDAETTCEVVVEVEGLNNFQGCDAELTDTVTVYPTVDAAGALDQDCTGNFSWDLDLGEIESSDAGVDVSWEFTGVSGADDEDTCTPPYDEENDDCGDGTSSVSSSNGAAVEIDGTLTITDLQLRDTDGDPETDAVQCDDVVIELDSIDVHQPVLVTLTPQADATCTETDPNDPVNDISYDLAIQGGSGDWDLAFTVGGDAVLDTTLSPLACRASGDVTDADQDFSVEDCLFAIGTDFCATGDVDLVVTDNEDDECCVGEAAAACAGTVEAVRVSTLDVTPLAD